MPRWTADMLTELGAIRYAQGISRSDAAYNFRVSLETLRRYEVGGVSLPMEIAEEMSEYTKYNVLTQAATSALSQANELPQQALQLLG